MKIRKVSADVLDRPAARTDRELSPREQRRRALEGALENAIKSARSDAASAFRLELEAGEKPATVRQAFNRVRVRVVASSVNLFARQGWLFIANRPQVRGRRARQ